MPKNLLFQFERLRTKFVVNFTTFLKHFGQPNTKLVENPSSLLFSYVSLSLISCSLSQLKTHSISQLKTKSLHPPPSLSLSLSPLSFSLWVGLYLISLSLSSMVKIAVEIGGRTDRHPFLYRPRSRFSGPWFSRS